MSDNFYKIDDVTGIVAQSFAKSASQETNKALTHIINELCTLPIYSFKPQEDKGATSEDALVTIQKLNTEIAELKKKLDEAQRRANEAEDILCETDLDYAEMQGELKAYKAIVDMVFQKVR